MVFIRCNSEDLVASIDLWRFIQDLGPTIVSLLAVIVTFWVTRLTLIAQSEQNIKILNAQKDSEARLLIQKKLNEFYGPLIQQRLKSAKLYEKFIANHKNDNPDFSALVYLLENHGFTGNDKILLEQIIKLGEESEKLIQEKSGLIDDTDLRLNILPIATTHFLLMKLAYSGEIKGDVTNFKDLTYPSNLIEKLEERKAKLEKDLETLNTI